MRRLMSCAAASLALSACAALDSVMPGQNDPYLAQQQAMAAYEDEDNVRAEALFKSVLRVAPNDVPTWFYLGNLHARAQRPKEAAEAYEKVLMLNPNHERAWHNLAVVRLRQSRAAYIRAFELMPPGHPLHARTQAVLEVLSAVPQPQGARAPSGQEQ